jgi:hypothetical protein
VRVSESQEVKGGTGEVAEWAGLEEWEEWKEVGKRLAKGNAGVRRWSKRDS